MVDTAWHAEIPASYHIDQGMGRQEAYMAGAMGRMQMRVAICTVLERFPEIQLAVPAEEMRWEAGNIYRGPETLPVKG